MGIVTLLFLAGGFVFWKINSSRIKLAQYQPIKSIAILPFRNESNNQDNEYLSDGITESIINRLAELPEISVKARNSVFQYKGKAVNPQRASKELSVEALLLGRVVEYGNNLTITLELVDGITGRTDLEQSIQASGFKPDFASKRDIAGCFK
jgi:TolB-like protein